MASSNDIRAAFLDYFARNGHEIVASSPLVPRNDPTLMFTNAGMVQFKNVFTGQEKRPYVRATTAQKCVRAGGKHNDLDNVGYTARHHTFFEMLGNFSFGDYFKEQAIPFAWELVTKDFGLAKDRLLVTVFSEDDEAAEIWRKVTGFSDDRIIRIPTDANFWRMGETGPCGPCSEIFYDHGPEIPGGPPGSSDEDGDRFIEIWNLVFMQFEEGPPGTRVALPRPSIDTGLGLERFAAILQGKHDNYDTDTFRALILASAEATGQDPDGPARVHHRVVADHLRSTAFLIADGVLPSNEGRGYVLRRIMRRAMRHVQMMGAREPVMYRLVPSLVRQMGAAYPELVRAETLIVETLLLEETRFRQTLERGLHLLGEETARLGERQPLPGAVAFRLYDTFGFPLDLTQDALREQGREVDLAGFEAAMDEQRTRARAAWAGSGEAATERVWFEIKERVGASEFLGYSTETAEGEIAALVVGGVPVDRASAGAEVAVVLNQTPFYGESGGQVGDTGTITGPDGLRIAVTDTQKKLGDLFVHLGRVEAGEARLATAVVAAVDHARRTTIRAHPSRIIFDFPATLGMSRPSLLHREDSGFVAVYVSNPDVAYTQRIWDVELGDFADSVKGSWCAMAQRMLVLDLSGGLKVGDTIELHWGDTGDGFGAGTKVTTIVPVPDYAAVIHVRYFDNQSKGLPDWGRSFKGYDRPTPDCQVALTFTVEPRELRHLRIIRQVNHAALIPLDVFGNVAAVEQATNAAEVNAPACRNAFGVFEFADKNVQVRSKGHPLTDAPAMNDVVDGFSIYWGDVHTHSAFSRDCIEREKLQMLPADLMRFARDRARLDFFAVTDHQKPGDNERHKIGASNWAQTLDAIREYDCRGRFLVFSGFEYQCPRGDTVILCNWLPQYEAISDPA